MNAASSRLLVCLTLILLLGCDLSSPEDEPDGRLPSGEAFFLNPGDPRLIQIKDTNGETVTLFGIKDNAGVPIQITGWSRHSGDASRADIVTLTPDGRIATMALRDGGWATVTYNDTGDATIILTSEGGAQNEFTIANPYSSSSSLRERVTSHPTARQVDTNISNIDGDNIAVRVLMRQKRTSYEEPIDNAHVRFRYRDRKSGLIVTEGTAFPFPGNYLVPVPASFIATEETLEAAADGLKLLLTELPCGEQVAEGLSLLCPLAAGLPPLFAACEAAVLVIPLYCVEPFGDPSFAKLLGEKIDALSQSLGTAINAQASEDLELEFSSDVAGLPTVSASFSLRALLAEGREVKLVHEFEDLLSGVWTLTSTFSGTQEGEALTCTESLSFAVQQHGMRFQGSMTDYVSSCGWGANAGVYSIWGTLAYGRVSFRWNGEPGWFYSGQVSGDKIQGTALANWNVWNLSGPFTAIVGP